MVIFNKKCVACGTKYSYCPDCSRADSLKPTWYNDFCSESCKDLWFTLARYNMGRITKSEAKSAILELELNPIESYSRFVRRDYAKVMAEGKKPRKTHKKVEPVIEVALTEQSEEVAEVEQSTVHEVVIKKENE